MNNKNGGPAFPDSDGQTGITLRDYFAAKAMQAFLTDPTLIWTYQTCVSCAKKRLHNGRRNAG